MRAPRFPFILAAAVCCVVSACADRSPTESTSRPDTPPRFDNGGWVGGGGKVVRDDSTSTAGLRAAQPEGNEGDSLSVAL